MNKTNLGVALVTGASSGIGHATAKALQNAGFRVFGTSRRAVAERSHIVTMLSCDVTDDASVEERERCRLWHEKATRFTEVKGKVPSLPAVRQGRRGRAA
jgi:short-subunit dehydrogenase